MKRQFMQIKPAQVNNNIAQTPPSQQILDVSSQETAQAPVPPANMINQNVPPNWQAGTQPPYPPMNNYPAGAGRVEPQSGTRQRPMTGPVAPNGNSLQGFFPGHTPQQPGNIPFTPQPDNMRRDMHTPPAFVMPNMPVAPQGPHSFAGTPPVQPMQGQMGYPNAAPYPAMPAYQNMPGSGIRPSMTPPPGGPPPGKRQKNRRVPTWGKALITVALLFIVLGGGGLIYYQYYVAPSINNIVGHQAILQPSKGNSQTQQKDTGPVLSGKRFTMLLLGSDSDGKNPIPLAQTDILVTIDPQTNYVGMLSIPRDMQLTDPVSGGHYKLDEMFSYGWQAKPGNNEADHVAAASGRSIQVIEANFGIHIDDYAWVGLQGFVKVVDTANGVDVDVIHPMVDDVYPNDVNNASGNAYDYKRLYIAPGPQHLNGIQALEYVRTRHSDLVGDFGRSARQQQVLAQLKAKLATTEIVGKAPELLKDMNGFVQTGLQLTDIVKIANYARTVDVNKVERITLSPPYSRQDGTRGNYLPNCPMVREAINKMFGLNGNANCIPQVALPRASNGSAGVALTLPSTTASASISQTPLVSIMQTTQQSSQTNTVDADGIRSLLNLMFLTVFESFDAAQV